MLASLFGSKSVEKILLFLLVHESCYASELCRILLMPLTPVQKALLRLEKGGIVTSRYVGKTRVYQFNSHYPYLRELESLLQKAYALLPLQEKKDFLFIRQEAGEEASLMSLWKRLQSISKLQIIGKNADKTERQGEGEVTIFGQGTSELTFHEEGTWDDGIEFRNVFRWTLSRVDGMISLEHLRYGLQNPVFLFHLTPKKGNVFEAVKPHVCGQDTYFGHLNSSKERVKLTWRILGPKKNDENEYIYS